MSAQVRSAAPSFDLPALQAGAVTRINSDDLGGKWVVLAWYPKDATAICGSELPVFDAMGAELDTRGAVLVAASTQGIESKQEWVAGELGSLGIPLMADEGGSVAEAYGILLDNGLSLRATFIIDPDGVLRWASINDLPIGRNSDEILRTLDALQSGGACVVNWTR